MTTLPFDDRNIPWKTLEGFEHAAYHVLEVDEQNRIVDVVFKFAAHQQVMLHNHKCPYRTFVLQGELRIYRANGELKEVRPVGSYVTGGVGGEPHREGGGDQDAIVLFNNRDITDAIYEFLDDDFNPVATLGIKDFKALL